MRYAAVLSALLLSGCAPHVHQKVAAAPPNRTRSYIDLEPGWRLYAVTPLSKTGEVKVPQLTAQRTSGNTITATMNADFAGYEVSIYNIARTWGGNLRIGFESAEFKASESTTERNRPAVALFQLGHRRVRFARLLYLQRASTADHNMAFLASSQLRDLNRLTERVEANPASCVASAEVYCGWIPPGIALRPERRRAVSGPAEWVAADPN